MGSLSYYRPEKERSVDPLARPIDLNISFASTDISLYFGMTLRGCPNPASVEGTLPPCSFLIAAGSKIPVARVEFFVVGAE
jgi:hypothetical protein